MREGDLYNARRISELPTIVKKPEMPFNEAKMTEQVAVKFSEQFFSIDMFACSSVGLVSKAGGFCSCFRRYITFITVINAGRETNKFSDAT